MPTTPDLTQPWLDEFETIRNFHDSEVNEQIRQLLASEEFTVQLDRFVDMAKALPREVAAQARESLPTKLKTIASTQAFQALEAELLQVALHSMLKKLTCVGLEQLDPQKQYVFVSNHRDIVLDPLIINWALMQTQLGTAYCAIGDNLLGSETSKKLALLNKCFAVLRSIRSPRAMVAAMRTQSAFIRYIQHNLHSSVWIAQREGRSKDNTDLTNPALLKMLGLAKPKDMDTTAYLKALNIVPVSLSYEWDPCDIQKARQCLASKSGDYQKTGQQDLESIELGLTGSKGRIQCSFDVAFGSRLPEEINLNEFAGEIDRAIHRNYSLFPVNYAAWQQHKPADAQAAIHQNAIPYSESELATARDALNKRLANTPDAVKLQTIQTYAQPVINLLRANSKD